MPFMFIVAQEEGGQGASSYTFLIYIALFIAIFYFLLIRPGQKQKKAHQQLVQAVKKGDEVVTAGGLYGTVTRVAEDYIMVEVAKKTVIKLSRGSIAKIISAGEIEEAEPEDEPEGEPSGEAEEAAPEPVEGQIEEPERKEGV